MNKTKWIQRNTASLAGKTIAITGSTGGLGRPLCRMLAALGASLVLVDRNRSRSMAFGAELMAEFPDLKLRYITADLADMASVAKACAQLEVLSLDAFIHNAGAYGIPRPCCSTGFDPLFQINFVSPYYMIRRLLPALAAKGGRVVAVGSIAHRYAKADAEEIDFAGRPNALSYGNAKRYLMVALYELMRSYPHTIRIAHPGITFTGITDHYPKWLFLLIKHPMKVIFMRPKAAALSILYGLFTPTGEEEWIGPWLFDIWGRPKKSRLKPFLPHERRLIADTAEQIYQNLT